MLFVTGRRPTGVMPIEIMQIECPGCSAPLELPSGSGGAETECPACGLEFEVPVTESDFDSWDAESPSPPVAKRWTGHKSVFDEDYAEPLVEAIPDNHLSRRLTFSINTQWRDRIVFRVGNSRHSVENIVSR